MIDEESILNIKSYHDRWELSIQSTKHNFSWNIKSNNPGQWTYIKIWERKKKQLQIMFVNETKGKKEKYLWKVT